MKQTSAGDPADPQRQRDARRRSIGTLRTSSFDAVTSLLAASILLLGTLVLLLAAVWMWSDTDRQNAPPPPFTWGTVSLDSSPTTDFLVPGAAQQLDHYEIELGLIGGGIAGLDYASSLSNQPNLRHGDSGSEKRLYFMWSRVSPLIRFDRQLLQRAYAHAATADAVTARAERREILKFIPPALENQLAKIELEYAMARGRSFNSIAKSVFFCESGGDGYQFVVRQQRYRKQKD